MGKLIKKRYLLILVIVVIFVGYFFYQKNQKIKANNKLTFQNPKIENITQTLEVSGYIDAKQKATLRFAAGGKLITLAVKEGDLVEKGDLIAAIDKRTLQKQLQQNLNNYMKERWDFEQAKDDRGEYNLANLENRRTADQEQWDLENSVITVELTDIAISDTNMSAPFNGVITAIPADTTGINLLYTDAFEIINPDSLIFKALVDEEDIAIIRKNQLGKIKLDAYEDEEFEANVNFISLKSTQSTSGTAFEVELPIHENNPLEKFRLGMNGDVSIEIETKDNVLTIPLGATKEKNGEIFVDLKKDQGEIEERKIKVGLETEEKVEVLEGLSTNDLVLIPE